MRILGFSKEWDKLNRDVFTTFRFPRKDKDWQVGETVKIEYRPRSPVHFTFGIAQIISKELRLLADVTHEEAVEDGFINLYAMYEWLQSTHRDKDMFRPINKLTLGWIKK